MSDYPCSLSVVVKKFESGHVLALVEHLGAKLVNGTEALLDTYATGINNVITHLPDVKVQFFVVAFALGLCLSPPPQLADRYWLI